MAVMILYVRVGDVKHVMVNGEYHKRDAEVTASGYDELQELCLRSAERIQDAWI